MTLMSLALTVALLHSQSHELGATRKSMKPFSGTQDADGRDTQ
jgi:hypothetical protein